MAKLVSRKGRAAPLDRGIQMRRLAPCDQETERIRVQTRQSLGEVETDSIGALLRLFI